MLFVVCVRVYVCRTLRRVRTRKDLNPSDLLRLVKQPARETRSAVRAADYLEYTLQLLQDRHHIHKRSLNATGTHTHTHTHTHTQTDRHNHRQKHTLMHYTSMFVTDLISAEDLQTIARLTGCAARVRQPNCKTTPHLNQYRTTTSVCNNR